MSNKLLQFWSVLQTREKITVLSGATLVLVTAVYLLFNGLWTSRSALMQDRTALIEEREWMQEQSAVAERLVSNCRDNQFFALTDSDLLELLASRNQLVLENFRQRPANGEIMYSMEIESMDGNSILRFIHQSACQGFSLTNVLIDRSEQATSFTGRLEFNHEG